MENFKRIENLLRDQGIEQGIALDRCSVRLKEKNRIHLLALGDVGMTVLLGLKLLGADVIESIGICDVAQPNMVRLEQELNQVRYPFEPDPLPKVDMVTEETLFDCDLFIFCASKGVPPIGTGGDVRMAQLEANREIIKHYASLAAEADYQGMVCIVSDPVDPLCKAFLMESGLHPGQIQGFGLGVMHARGLYFAEKNPALAHYSKEGAAFGPHGEDLVLADSIENYDDNLSKELTNLVIHANMKVRELGYKPYIAPALSSAAISILLTLRGEWHYSSLYLGDENEGAFLGIKNYMSPKGPVYEDLPLCPKLYERIQQAYKNLCDLK